MPASIDTLRREPQAVEPGAGHGLLFLREEQLRQTQDLLFFAYRDFTGVCDPILAELGLGRAHHRALHFIGARPEITVGELLGLLRVTKQSLARVLATLLRDELVRSAAGESDRRQRRLTLSERGRALERRLFEAQRELMVAAFGPAGVAAVEGFRRVLRGLAEADGGAAARIEARPGDRPRHRR